MNADVLSMTDQQIDDKLDRLERQIARAKAKNLPTLNAAFNVLLAEQVRRDMIKLEQAGIKGVKR